MLVRPLPRSLDPLPGESLPGYLLRLAHRLDRSPGRIAILTGLRQEVRGRSERVSVHSLLHLEAATAATFAHATRLSLQEVAGLASWVLTQSTRYCPHCLAGDGSAIQQAHGGAWQKLWRLPVVFACTTHRRLLLHECPQCRRPAHSRRQNDGLLPRFQDATLHPAQCRSAIGPKGRNWRAQSACGARLDPASPAPLSTVAVATGRQTVGCEDPMLERLLAVQHRLLALLQPAGPATTISVGQSATIAEYFSDLRLLVGLIRASWPAARPLAESWMGADAIDHYLERHRWEVASRRQQGRVPRSLHNRPPLASDACGSLLAIAGQFLALEDPRMARERLNPLLIAQVSEQPSMWLPHFLRVEAHCSDGLRTAVAPLVERLRPIHSRPGRKPGARRPPLRDCRFGPQHIPQFLPADWFERHFQTLTGINPHVLRRFASVKLLQMTAGGSQNAAGAHLGLPQHSITSTRSQVLQWGKNGTNAARWHALEALACELDAATDLIDYRRRRDALAAWSMPPDDWQELAAGFRHRQTWHGRANTRWGDHKRQVASVLVWARVTQSEPRLAPLISTDKQAPDHRSQLALSLAQARYQSRRPGRYGEHWFVLKEALDAYADQLAARIDAG